MAQILITHPKNIHLYSPIASIKQYSEPQFEDKLFRYGKSIFQHYYVFKFKYPLTCDAIPGVPYKPDLLLVSKSFKKWVLIEVELCKPPTQHTLDQITCFSKPKYKPKEIADFIIKHNKEMKPFATDLLKCFTDATPDLLVVLDDYSDDVFQRFYKFDQTLKICVLEVYKRVKYNYEGYRFGGDYPYELTNSSPLTYIDSQHYKIIKKDFAKDLPQNFQLKFDMEPFNASVVKDRRAFALKLPEHNIPKEFYLQIGINLNKEYVIQKL